MKAKNQFKRSNEILELSQYHRMQAESLIAKLWKNSDQSTFIEIDCIPNGSLNPFHYDNGLESARIISEIAGSFLGEDRERLEYKLDETKNSGFKTNFEVGEEAGLWQKLSPNDYEKRLDWFSPFCVKNKDNVTKIWHPDFRQLGFRNGFSTRGGIVKFIHEGSSYLQKFYMPLPAPNGALAWRMNYRLVFLCEPGNKMPELIGGLWISRPGFKAYLSGDSIVGLISPHTTVDVF